MPTEGLSSSYKALAGLSQAEIDVLSQNLNVINCQSDEIRLLERSESPALYFVSQGSLKVAIRNRYQEFERVFEVTSGETILEKALLDSAPVTTIVKAKEASQLLKLSRDAFDQFTAKHPNAGHLLVENASRISQRRSRFPERVAGLFQSLTSAASRELGLLQKSSLILGCVKNALCADICVLIDYQHFKVVGDPNCTDEAKEAAESLLFEQSGFAVETRANQGARLLNDVKGASAGERRLLKDHPHAMGMPLRRDGHHDYVLLLFSKESFESTDLRLLEATTEHLLLILNTASLVEQIGDLESSHEDALKRAHQQRTSFVSQLSHEIRNPLASIVGTIDYLNLYQKDELGEVADLLPRIDRAAKHVLDIINEALDYSKAESGKLVIQRDWTNFNELINEVRDITMGYVQRLNKSSLNIDFGALYNLPSVYIDYTKIKQVLINLVTNAVKFTSTGHVKLFSWIENSELVMAIEDTGVGIKKEDREKVFQAYELGHPATDVNPCGTGLGLSISKSIIEQHGGKIWFDSTEGEGSTFFISIPLVPPKE